MFRANGDRGQCLPYIVQEEAPAKEAQMKQSVALRLNAVRRQRNGVAENNNFTKQRKRGKNYGDTREYDAL